MSRSNPQQNAPNPATRWTGETIESFIGYEPTGICACGCGQPTRIPSKNVRTKNRFKGIPVQFVKGHYRRVLPTQGYKAKIVLGSLKKVHRLRAEAALGKQLPDGAIVHHADGSKDAAAALVICQDSAYHSLLHYRMRVKAAGGNPNTDRICRKCQSVKHLNLFYKNRSGVFGYASICKSCDNERTAQR